MHKALILASLILGTMSLHSQTAVVDTITLAAEDAWIPYANPDGTGMSVDIVKAAYAAVGIEVKVDVRPYKRILAEVKQGKYIGGFNVPRDLANENDFRWSNQILFQAHSNFYTLKTRPLKAKNYMELNSNERIGVILAYGYGNYFQNNKNIIKEWSTSEEFNLKKLLNGRLDAVILYDKSAKYWFNRMGIGHLVASAFPNESVDIYVGFSKVHPLVHHYRHKFEEGMKIIKRNGVYNTIISRY